ncbi:MAG TPA: MFS transporter [Candidatus Omnitrophota bacterium]|nr:MFS transporter [Candidatus Omnitrophota bacterium]HRZ14596.1 MFS transporter [Candidatus Omnitrophota bacterium]
MASNGSRLPSDPLGLQIAFRALRYRNFRLFFGGQIISLTGTWMQQMAMGWMVYRLTHSPLMLGIVGFVSQIPSFVLSPFAGVLADHFNRHRIIIITQVLSMLQASILAFYVLTGTISIAKIIVLGAFLGLINAVDIPARHSFLFEMIDNKEDLGNAIALNSMMFNAARLIGPSVAGVLIGLWGEGFCFLLNGLSFLAVIGALLLMRLRPRPHNHLNGQPLQKLQEGFRYAFGFAPIRSILFLVATVSLMAMSVTVLMPVFARDILGGGAHTLGFLVGATGLGALSGAIFIASREKPIGLSRLMPVSSGLFFGLGMVVFSFSRNVGLSMLVLFFTGLGLMIHMVLCNTVLQTIVDDDKRGRVMSLYTMAFMGMATFGSLLGGSLASKIGSANTVRLGALVCMLISGIFFLQLPRLKVLVKPLYQKSELPLEHA